MQTEQPHSEEDSTGIATHWVELGVAACVLAFGITVLVGSRNLGAGWTSDGPGAGYFPFYIGLFLCIAAAVIIGQTLFAKEKNTEPFVTNTQLKLVLQVLLPALVYVGAVQLLGLYVASAIYIALFMVILGHYSWVKSVSIAVIINVTFFMMFEVWFKVPLFKGILDPLRFLGY